MSVLRALAAVALLLTACITFPAPPPSMLPTDLRPPAAGRSQTVYGASALWGISQGSPSRVQVVPNVFGGAGLVGLRHGLGRLDLSLRLGLPLGPNLGVELGGTLARAGGTRLDALAGLGTTYADVSVNVCDARSTSPECSDGEHMQQVGSVSFAPSLGVRASTQLGDAWTLGAAMRASHAMQFPLKGRRGEVERMPWFEPMLAVAYQADEHWGAGLSLGGYLLPDTSLMGPMDSWFIPTFSASIARTW